ncbi:diacylglycerol kinase family protein [Mesoaciditoga lauensis]|uniref:diacylglycerol kinase family protein n=1 Tax=Mesoaciditoga lauensis TaxID=1495039 RepID=UPI00068F1698|nr:diacylglycerol kinase family protein [Mesoaciditoga lauensis]
MSNSNHRRTILKSFEYAFQGLAYVLKRERNMKIHFAAALGAIIFSVAVGIDAENMLWIFLAIALVMITEILNTFFEELLDFVNPQYSEAVKHMKDMAAGGVLMAAIFAIVVAIGVFGKRFGYDLYWVSETVFLVYLFLVIVLVLGGGKKNEKNKSGNHR